MNLGAIGRSLRQQFVDAPIRGWDWFWFRSRNADDQWALALFRIAFVGTMLFFYFTRAFDVSLFYGELGLLPRGYARTMEFSKYHFTPLFYVHNLSLIHGLHTLFLAVLACQMVGFFTRTMSALAYVLHLFFIFRNPTIMFGVDMIGTFFFLYLVFADSGAVLSVDAWRAARAGKPQRAHGWLSHIAFRLMQVQLCVIYAFAGLEKLKGTRWWDGSAIWDIFSMGSMQRWDFSFVAHVPVVIAIATYVVLFWEIYFPVLVWHPVWKRYFLWGGLFMHIGIGLFMSLPAFAFLMVSIYALFLEGSYIRQTALKYNLAPRHN